MRAGFPHSDICGSKLVCQLPAAFRRLPRPSSPVIAKASTACTYSLDPITANAPPHRAGAAHLSSHRTLTRLVATPLAFCSSSVSIQSIKPSRSKIRSPSTPSPRIPAPRRLAARNAAHREHRANRSRSPIAYFFQFVKEQPNNSKAHRQEPGQLAHRPALPVHSPCLPTPEPRPRHGRIRGRADPPPRCQAPGLVVELIGIEPTTPCLQSRCSPS